MATSLSARFHAHPDRIWAAIVPMINGAGYSVSETNSLDKLIRYKASGGGWAGEQLVTASVLRVEDDNSMVSVTAISEGTETLTEGRQQEKLVNFIINNLANAFPTLPTQPKTRNGSESWLSYTAQRAPNDSPPKSKMSKFFLFVWRAFVIRPLAYAIVPLIVGGLIALANSISGGPKSKTDDEAIKRQMRQEQFMENIRNATEQQPKPESEFRELQQRVERSKKNPYLP